MGEDVGTEHPERQAQHAGPGAIESPRPREHDQAADDREQRHHQPGELEELEIAMGVDDGELLRERNRRRVFGPPTLHSVEWFGLRLRHHDRQRGDQLEQRRVVVIELERPLLPVADAGRHVHDLVDRRVLQEETLSRQGVMERQQPDHGDTGPEPGSPPGTFGLALDCGLGRRRRRRRVGRARRRRGTNPPFAVLPRRLR